VGDWVGYAAALLTTSAFLPQALKTFRTGQTRDISLGMYVLLVTGVTLWLVYGLMMRAMPVILSNVVTLALSGAILVMKWRKGS
jgi:MtN3 and saliva related transmembrane protein